MENLANSEAINEDIDFDTMDDSESIRTDSGDFFDALDRDVNGLILDDQPAQETATQDTPDPVQTVQAENSGHDWEKRYKDSSREAQRLKSELTDEKNRNENFKPLLERLQTDAGLVDTIRNYVDGGGNPQDMKTALNLPDDFIFDLEEAVTTPGSNSSKALEHVIGSAVDRRVNTQLEKDRSLRDAETSKARQEAEAKVFKEKMEMSDEDFGNMMQWAEDHEITLEDIYNLKNQTTHAKNVAKSTKEDMLKQMKSVRDIPTSVANKNTERVEKSPDQQVFEAIKSVDNDLDNLFDFG